MSTATITKLGRNSILLEVADPYANRVAINMTQKQASKMGKKILELSDTRQYAYVVERYVKGEGGDAIAVFSTLRSANSFKKKQEKLESSYDYLVLKFIIKE